MTEFPALLLVKSCLPAVDTLYQTNRMLDNFPIKYLPFQSQQKEN